MDADRDWYRARDSDRDARIKIAKIAIFAIFGPLGPRGTKQWDGHLGSFLGQKSKKFKNLKKS